MFELFLLDIETIDSKLKRFPEVSPVLLLWNIYDNRVSKPK